MNDPIGAVNFTPALVSKDGDPHLAMASVRNVYIKQMYFVKPGDKLDGHKHVHDHATLLASGAVEVTVNGVTTPFRAPKIIWIAADCEHMIVATKAHTVAYCVHAIRNGDGVDDIIDPESIPNGTLGFHMPANAKSLLRSDKA